MRFLATGILLALYGFLVMVVAGTFLAAGINRDDDALRLLGAVVAGVLCVLATVAVRGIWAPRQE